MLDLEAKTKYNVPMIEIDQKLVYVTRDGISVTGVPEAGGELSQSAKISIEDLVRAMKGFAEKLENKPYASAVIRQAASTIANLKDQIKER